jgi:hypothetical protein
VNFRKRAVKAKTTIKNITGMGIMPKRYLFPIQIIVEAFYSLALRHRSSMSKFEIPLV